jgi:hypothetical protein
MLDQNNQAARVFWRLVRDFAESKKPWDEAINYDVRPDEQWDATLVSQRVYGRRSEYMTVLAAAGISSVDEPLDQRRIVLPTESQLRQLKFKAGFESRHDYREKGAPTWRTD